ncbi:acyltransferase family protein [Umezawaea endophytica]|uniref:Acyltransferase n=1 Tax=Umezawaea endophytica TaxID=1654476 RepID=A0A9X3AHC7_9PSEU|nr:acyltransferase [Umezawaea endophytica]MCS7481292.1 acyltransferase [Umezawaea endophytica]
MRGSDLRLPSLTGLRFLAALAVFGFHLNALGLFGGGPAESVVGLLFGPGAIGVSFFFVLSGFVLTWSARPDDTAASTWRRRAARVFPNHVVTWSLAVVGLLLLGVHDVSPLAVVLGLLLVQAWIPVPDVYFAVNTPAWSLSCEVAFYAAFPLLLKGIDAVRSRWLWPLACALVLGVLLVPVAAMPLSDGAAYWLVYICPLTRVLEFALGMVMAKIVQRGRWIGVKALPAFGLFLLAYFGSAHLPGTFGYVAATIVPLALLIPAAAVADVDGVRSVWSSRVAVRLGELSFAFYLVHHAVIRTLAEALEETGFRGPPAAVAAGVMLLVSLGAAWLLHRFVERPAYRLLARGRGQPVQAV